MQFATNEELVSSDKESIMSNHSEFVTAAAEVFLRRGLTTTELMHHTAELSLGDISR